MNSINDCDHSVNTIISRDSTIEDTSIVEHVNGIVPAVRNNTNSSHGLIAQVGTYQSKQNSVIVMKKFEGKPTKTNRHTGAYDNSVNIGYTPIGAAIGRKADVQMFHRRSDCGKDATKNRLCRKVVAWTMLALLIVLCIAGFTFFFAHMFHRKAGAVHLLPLEEEALNMSDGCDQLQTLNNDLLDSNKYLSETLQDLQAEKESLDLVVNALNAEFATLSDRGSLLLEIMQNTYSQRIANWDCAYRDMFRLEDFVYDGQLPIGAKSYTDVIKYVDGRVLSELCLNKTDFELYLGNEYVNPASATTGDNLVLRTEIYTRAAMNYYFPDKSDDEGLTQYDWAKAAYKCQNLPDEKRFSMM